MKLLKYYCEDAPHNYCVDCLRNLPKREHIVAKLFRQEHPRAKIKIQTISSNDIPKIEYTKLREKEDKLCMFKLTKEFVEYVDNKKLDKED